MGSRPIKSNFEIVVTAMTVASLIGEQALFGSLSLTLPYSHIYRVSSLIELVRESGIGLMYSKPSSEPGPTGSGLGPFQLY